MSTAPLDFSPLKARHDTCRQLVLDHLSDGVGDPRVIIKPTAAIIANCSLWVIHFISQLLSKVKLLYHVRFQKEHLGSDRLRGEATCLSLSAYSSRSATQAGGRLSTCPGGRSPRLLLLVLEATESGWPRHTRWHLLWNSDLDVNVVVSVAIAVNLGMPFPPSESSGLTESQGDLQRKEPQVFLHSSCPNENISRHEDNLTSRKRTPFRFLDQNPPNPHRNWLG